MKLKFIKPVFVDIIPDRIEGGVLYICERYKTVIHKCCCGCGEEVVTPLSPVDWSIRKVNDFVYLMPSIGNWSLTCKSHYYIQRNQVIWAEKFSQRQIGMVKARDNADKRAYIESINELKSKDNKLTFLISKLWKAFINWLIK